MKKGKFGIVLCFYPIAAFAAVILNAPIICFALAAAAIFIERDEWAGRQTLQAWMVSALVYFFDKVPEDLRRFFYTPRKMILVIAERTPKIPLAKISGR